MTAKTSPTLLVLAAGMGSRFGGLKQIEPVGPSGETIIDYSIYDALRAGFGKLVFVIRKDIEEAFKETVGARFEKVAPVEYVMQELDKLPAGYSVPAGRTKPWGTTHAILMGADAIHEPFAAINADDFYGAEGYRALANHLTSGSPDLAMVGFVLSNTLSEHGSVARGVCQVDGNRYLTDVVEMLKIERDGAHAKNTASDGTVTSLDGSEPVSMNMWAFQPNIFPLLKDKFHEFLETSGNELKAECLIPNTVNQLVKAAKARVKVLHTNDSWFGVTYREDQPSVVANIRALIAAGKYPEKLWK
jgi:UTP-glucose-1-phosphate uridylyltransferase